MKTPPHEAAHGALPDVTLTPSRPKGFGYMVMCAAFCAGGGAMISSGIKAGWYVTAVFGIGILVFLVMLLPGSSHLRLDSKGFVIRSLYRETRYAWTDAAGFGVAVAGVRRMVAFNFTPGFVRSRGLSKRLSGWDAALPDAYGLRPDRLEALMNAYLGRYGGRP